jgi:hypothetical protein
MRDSTLRSRFRRQLLLLAPAAFTASFLRGQNPTQPTSQKPETIPLQNPDNNPHPAKRSNGGDTLMADDRLSADDITREDGKPREVRLPNGKLQTDEMLKDDYAKNLKDARDLTGLARGLEDDLEKNEAWVFSLASLKKLDDMERLTKRIRARMKRA